MILLTASASVATRSVFRSVEEVSVCLGGLIVVDTLGSVSAAVRSGLGLSAKVTGGRTSGDFLAVPTVVSAHMMSKVLI